MVKRTLRSRILNFAIDDYINPWLPVVNWSRLPKPVSHILGRRDPPQPDVPNLLVWTWALIGAFLGILTVGAITKYSGTLQQYNPPVIIASLGATAILDYQAINVPLAQPRNAFLGQTLSAIIGVSISKLFQLNSNFVDLQWIAAAVSCAGASTIMGVTGTVHPPGGATAVLAATNAEIIAMGWMFIPFVMWASLVMLGIALLVNNIQRQYPLYWWTAKDLTKNKNSNDLEKAAKKSTSVDRISDAGREEEGQGHIAISISDLDVATLRSLQVTEQELAVLKNLQLRLHDAEAQQSSP